METTRQRPTIIWMISAKTTSNAGYHKDSMCPFTSLVFIPNKANIKQMVLKFRLCKNDRKNSRKPRDFFLIMVQDLPPDNGQQKSE